MRVDHLQQPEACGENDRSPLVVEVDDDGPLRPTLQIRPRPGGGFAVRAWLPLRQVPQHGGDR